MDFVSRGNGYLGHPDGIHEQPGKTLFLFSYGSYDDLQFSFRELVGNLNEFAYLFAGNDRGVYFHQIHLCRLYSVIALLSSSKTCVLLWRFALTCPVCRTRHPFLSDDPIRLHQIRQTRSEKRPVHLSSASYYRLLKYFDL